MLPSLLLLASAVSITAATADPARSAQTKNGEFIFSEYPPRALAAGEQGAVRFRAEVNAKGIPLSCNVTASSGYKLLDNETCELILEHARFAPALDQEGKTREAVHEGVVNWRIPGASTRAPKTAAATVPDKIICKRIPKTGSLVSHSRLCLTAREWNQYADQTQDEWGALQGRLGSTRGN